ncbi:hypothetical protein Tco_0333032 [Tanacetum coccineum]
MSDAIGPVHIKTTGSEMQSQIDAEVCIFNVMLLICIIKVPVYVTEHSIDLAGPVMIELPLTRPTEDGTASEDILVVIPGWFLRLDKCSLVPFATASSTSSLRWNNNTLMQRQHIIETGADIQHTLEQGEAEKEIGLHHGCLLLPRNTNVSIALSYTTQLLYKISWEGNYERLMKGGQAPENARKVNCSVGLCAGPFSWGPAVGGEGACTRLTLPNVEISWPLLSYRPKKLIGGSELRYSWIIGCVCGKPSSIEDTRESIQ